jgi:hypothetical protein
VYTVMIYPYICKLLLKNSKDMIFRKITECVLQVFYTSYYESGSETLIGIVSRDWGGLLMVWLNRTEVKYFKFKCCFPNELKMVPTWVRLSPEFLSGAGFPGEEFTPSWF